MSVFTRVFAQGGALSAALQRPLDATGKLADAADDTLPSLTQLRHWSFGLTHAAIVTGIAVGVALALHWALFALLRRTVSRREGDAESVAVREFNQSIRGAMVAVAISIACGASKLVDTIWSTVDQFVIPALVGWVLISLLATITEVMQRRANAGADVLAARSRNTRITLISRTISVLIAVVTVAMIMLGFPGVRHIGATIIASAGLLTLAVGAAAQPALKSLIAGMQVAITQPIRIGDFVVVDGDNGRVEDIRFSYVVIRNADERRIIVPTTRFLDTTFQNWTRAEGLTGSVVLTLKPGTAIGPVRAAFETIIAGCEDWDKRTHKLTVSDVRQAVVEVTMVVTAQGPAELGRLRPAVREAMIEWLGEHMPGSLAV